MRTDCGNHSYLLEPLIAFTTPLIKFSRQASEGQPETNAWCELNAQKVCADSLYNRDFLYQAKAVDYPRTGFVYDQWYCHYNGWINQEIRELSHDFDAMKKRAEEECQSEKYAHTGWNTTLTLGDMTAAYLPGLARGRPNKEEALLVGAWTCAMGSSGCDMAYCSYSFCDKGNGKFGVYDDCEGWDPVKGMP